ncbi:unnamed protein product [Amoebophrya sp. A120]|nr:unnamed protein product [Amoebophrya sp. A120]|eukprot:GSA120T00016448001.1
MIDPDTNRKYLASLDPEELAQSYAFFQGVSDREIKFEEISAREVLREYNDSGEQFGTVGFWKRLLRRKLQVPLHVVQIVVEQTTKTKNTEDGEEEGGGTPRKLSIVNCNVNGGEDDCDEGSSDSDAEGNKNAGADVVLREVDLQLHAAGGEEVPPAPARRTTNVAAATVEVGLREDQVVEGTTAARAATTPGNTIKGDEDEEDSDEEDENPAWESSCGRVLAPGDDIKLLFDNIRQLQMLKESKNVSGGSGGTTARQVVAVPGSRTRTEGVQCAEDEHQDEHDDQMIITTEYRVVCNMNKMRLEKERNDLHRLKWSKLNSLGHDLVSEFFYLEKWREHVDFKSAVRSGWKLLLPPKSRKRAEQSNAENKDELIGHKNIERAFYDYPSKIDGKLYDILLHKYPYERACYNKAEFYRLCHESPYLAAAMVEHPDVDIPDNVLNVIDPTGVTMFNNKATGTEELGLSILDKYGERLHAKMLNAIVEVYHTSCLTRAIVAGYEQLALRFCELRDGRTRKPMLTLKTLTEDCKQGYAIYHRHFGRQFTKLQEFQAQHGRYPKPYDMALILGMWGVAEKIEALIQEWRG